MGAIQAMSNAMSNAQPLANLQDWLVAALARELALDPARVDVRAPFAEFGVESVQALALAAELEDLVGCELPVTLLWDYPTIESLARHLVEATP